MDKDCITQLKVLIKSIVEFRAEKIFVHICIMKQAPF